MTLLIAGGTGFIGKALIASLKAEGHNLIVLARSIRGGRPAQEDGLRYLPWNGREISAVQEEIGRVDGIVNLAGASIGGRRWTRSRKALILSSRIEATRALRLFASRQRPRPSVLVNSSAVGYYGPVSDGVVREDHPPGSDFLARTAAAWENEASAFEALGLRVVRLRFGIVLGRSGGALRRLALPFRFGLGGAIGSGEQWFSWIHIVDAVGLIKHALTNSSLDGPVNATAPRSVTANEFAIALGKALRRPSWADIPAPLLRFALGEMSTMILTGQNAVPERVRASGYSFHFATLEGALNDLLA
jgi:uncharacterized protein (TIGR01777 family)